MKIEHYYHKHTLNSKDKNNLINFLKDELEQYGDPKEAIKKAIDYAEDMTPGKGGLIAVMYDNTNVLAAAVVNHTGMQDYIPENILVYIAVDRNFRGKGFGKKLLSNIIEELNGDIALHVEPENPAIYLYRSLGFSQKYYEMRLLKEGQ